MNKWKEKSKKIFSPLIEEKSKIYDNEIWFFGKRKKRKQRAESKWNSWMQTEKLVWCRHWNISKDKYSK